VGVDSRDLCVHPHAVVFKEAEYTCAVVCAVLCVCRVSQLHRTRLPRTPAVSKASTGLFALSYVAAVVLLSAGNGSRSKGYM
jgi:hypothetical protein